MGTHYSVQITSPFHADQQTLQQTIAALLEDINAIMSTYREDSELSLLNKRGAGHCWPISKELAVVIEEALALSQLSEGAFDVTVGPIVNLWGFGPDFSITDLPSVSQIESALRNVGYQKLQFDKAQRCISKQQDGIYIDLSAIAKGYAIDRIAAYLNMQGMPHHLIEIGGDLRGGTTSDGWKLAIEQPIAQQRSVHRTIKIHAQGIATSGDYRNFFEINGQRYAHIIDPKSGRPVTHNLVSVTVVADSAMLADGLATLLLVLGPQAGLQFAEAQQIAAYLISREHNSYRATHSRAFAPFLKVD